MGFFIIFSFIFHFLLTTSTLYFVEKYRPNSKKLALTQIEIIEPDKDSLQQKIDKSRQLIKQLKIKVTEINDPTKIARFESEKTQRVEKETKAKDLGQTRNQTRNFIKNSMPEIKRQMTENTSGELLQKNQERLPLIPSSAVSSILPNDIHDSNATNLNTDANIHYSFYSRVEDLFYVRWVERVRNYWDHISFDYKKNVLTGKVWTTILEVWLNSTGEFHSAHIKQASGFKAFDEAAVFAFKNARFFPNPPRTKIEADGFVRLRYRFSVHVANY